MKNFLLSILLAFLLLSSNTSYAQTYSSEAEYRAILLELIELLQEQVQLLQLELAEEREPFVYSDDGYSSLKDDVDVLATYNINRSSDVDKISNRKNRNYFKRVFELFPEEYDQKIKQLVLFEDEADSFDAFVETLPPQHQYWLYATNEAMLGELGTQSNDELIIHELAHLVQYEEIIGVPKPGIQTCDTYFRSYGCPPSNSYLGQFVDEFWSADDLDRVGSYLVNGETIEKAYDYYGQHSSDFVSDYSAVSPEEDFAETFMFYVLGLEVKGYTAKQKIDFISSYSELRSLRSKILENL